MTSPEPATRHVPAPLPSPALLDAVEADLAAVEVALARLDAGTYFACEACGADLDDDRLAAGPTVRTCPACSAAA